MRPLLVLVALVLACGSKAHHPPVDAGTPDAGPADAGCVPEPDEDFCHRLHVECGPLTGVDNCGASRTLDCQCPVGTCTANSSGMLFCQPPPCQPKAFDPSQCDPTGQSARCGPLDEDDGCGGVVRGDCGNCPGGHTCAPDTGICCKDEQTADERCANLCAGADGPCHACGVLAIVDQKCGDAIETDCGACPQGMTCADDGLCH